MNTVAQLANRTRKYDHITPVLQDLHCLLIDSRSTYEIKYFVYKSYDLALSHSSKSLALKPKSGLSPDEKLVINLPTKLNTKTNGDRFFSIAGPNPWNDVPMHLRLSESMDFFKRFLKREAFNL